MSKEKFIELPLCSRCREAYCETKSIPIKSVTLRPSDIFAVYSLGDGSSQVELYNDPDLNAMFHVKATKAQVLWLAFKVRDVETIVD